MRKKRVFIPKRSQKRYETIALAIGMIIIYYIRAVRIFNEELLHSTTLITPLLTWRTM